MILKFMCLHLDLNNTGYQWQRSARAGITVEGTRAQVSMDERHRESLIKVSLHLQLLKLHPICLTHA
jgi:hypothetical protein